MKFPQFDHLEARLIAIVSISMVVFSVVASIFTYNYAYQQQLNTAAALEQQLVAAVQAQAEVAAFAANNQIAQGVLSGLIASPEIMAARIESTGGFVAELRYREKSAQGTQKSYPLLSPVNQRDATGVLTVIRNNDLIEGSAFKAAFFQTALMLGQLLISVIIMAVVLRLMMIRPITGMARAMASMVPGSSARLEIAPAHATDELGLLSHSANGLLDAAQQAIGKERSLRALLEATGNIAKIGGWSLDLKTNRLSWTTETYRIHGLSPTEPTSTAQAIQFYLPEARDIMRRAVDQCIKRGTSFDLELPLINAQGNQLWVRTQGNAIRKDGHIVEIYGALQDISERKRTEAELIQAKTAAESANRTKSHFLAAASHDLRQPMQAIALFQDALSRTDLDPEQKRFLDYLGQSTQSMGEILNSLLDISRLDAGMVQVSGEIIQAQSLAQRIDSEFAPLAASKSLRFKLSFPFRDVAMLTDGKLVMDLLRNLIGNAIKYTNKGGVLIAIRHRRHQALIQVWDTGIGIAGEHLDAIYDEYFQIGNDERDRSKGLGLGLAIARRIGKLLKTEIRCHSRPGKGSVFEFRLPLATTGENVPSGQSDPPKVAPSTNLTGCHVVLVEDDMMVGTATKLALESCGMTVARYKTAEEALADPDIAGADFYISALRLPGKSGIEFLDAVQQRATKPVKGLVLTGDTAVNRIEKMRSTAWPVLFKPVDLASLLAAIEERNSRQ